MWICALAVEYPLMQQSLFLLLTKMASVMSGQDSRQFAS